MLKAFLNLQHYWIRSLKISLGVLFALFLSFSFHAFASEKTEILAIPEQVEIDKYLGVWYEIARKPAAIQKNCAKNAMAIYTFNENGNIVINNRCLDQTGKLQNVYGEAFITNPPINSKFKVSFLPEYVRWIPVIRGDYWILKLDPEYQMALIGDPDRKNLWLIARTPNPDPVMVNQYLEFAKSEGYQLDDLIRTVQEQPKL
ncbi:lipocalin family protein [Acinetobacter stercoris]|uniref:Outer membrane lipoprotein Blc n=1 Tax=Acinetobacter stercoris TaxID=2126983 RepID=A0A2U3N2A2_9GAMM|nr:lipocalin family protein [Acinetobacter stercoris]SPL71792.1 Outer membrane lipoprotein Blc precursor [Acinetobacter stercoris]